MNAAREIFPDLSANKQQQQQMETDDDNDNDDGKGDAGSLDLLGCLKNLFMGKLGLCPFPKTCSWVK